MARVTLRVNSEVQLGVSIRYPSENSRGLRPLDPPWLFGAARRTLGGVSTSHPLRYALTPCAATRRWGMGVKNTERARDNGRARRFIFAFLIFAITFFIIIIITFSPAQPYTVPTSSCWSTLYGDDGDDGE